MKSIRLDELRIRVEPRTTLVPSLLWDECFYFVNIENFYEYSLGVKHIDYDYVSRWKYETI